MKTKEEQFIDWEGEVFGFGYGTGEEHTLKVLRSFMDSLENGRSYDHENLEKKLGATVAWLMINILCKADILEYGTSPRYGWLTEKGEKLKNFIGNKSVDDLYNLVTRVSDTYVSCGKTYCNCNPPDSFNKKCPNNELF